MGGSKKFSIPALILGIGAVSFGACGFIMCWFAILVYTAIIGFIFGLIGVILAIVSLSLQKKAKENNEFNGMLKGAKVTSIIGLVFSGIAVVEGISCIACILACAGAAGISSINSGSY